METENLKTLGKARAQYSGLETFPRPTHSVLVELVSDEVTALCPVTGQPDFYTVRVSYVPRLLCVESKTFKLFVQSFRSDGHFCEKFADILLEELAAVLKPVSIFVEVHQKPRGGVAIIARSQLPR